MDQIYNILPITETQVHDVIDLSNRVFGNGTSLLISKKHMWGYYATDGHQIAGAVILHQGSNNEGYLGWIFVSDHARGHGLASRLITHGFNALNEVGLSIQFALVRDDNTASWNMFYKAGYKIIPLYRFLFGYSLKGFFHRLNYTFLTGYSIWTKDDSNTQPTYLRFPIFRTLFSSILIGACIALFGLRDVQFLAITVMMTFLITLMRIIIAYPIARTYGKVRFMPSQGGYVLSILLALLASTWYPTFGFFVPKEETWRDQDFKANIGQQALATQFSLQIIFLLSALLFHPLFTQGLHWYLVIVLLYQVIPFTPFDGFDGGKVIRWHKAAYIMMLLTTIITIVMTYVFLF
jgi:GNAT superfamily N-acetyltransferase